MIRQESLNKKAKSKRFGSNKVYLRNKLFVFIKNRKPRSFLKIEYLVLCISYLTQALPGLYFSF